MSSQTAYRKRLKVLMNLPENQVCSDCPERQPRWASLIKPLPGSPPGSLSIGAFCCLECSGSHRRLGVHISFVRSITLDQWKEAEVRSMENGGNAKVNAIFEARLSSPTLKPKTHANGATRERFIRDKYERRKYYDAEILRRYNTGELGDNSSESSEEESSDSDSDTEGGGGNPRLNGRAAAVRAPSEAARLRAEKIRQRQEGQGRHRQPPAVTARRAATTAVAARRPAPPEVDLLDFGSLSTADANQPGSGPPPNPPSAAPSPTLDLFRHVNHSSQNSNHVGNGGVRSPTNAITSNGAQQQQQQQGKTAKDDDILAMFPQQRQQQQQQHQQHQQQQQQQPTQASGNFPFPSGLSNSAGPTTAAYGNGNTNNAAMMQNAMMQNAMMMNGNMNNFATNPNNNAMMMMMTPNGTAGSGANNPMMMNMNASMPNNYNNQMMQNQMMMNPQMMQYQQQQMMMQQQQQHQQQQGSMGNTNTNTAANDNIHNTPANPQQQQQEMMAAAPMGGTPSNLNVLGGVKTGSTDMSSSMGNVGGSGQVAGGGDGNASSNSKSDPFEQFGAFRSF